MFLIFIEIIESFLLILRTFFPLFLLLFHCLDVNIGKYCLINFLWIFIKLWSRKHFFYCFTSNKKFESFLFLLFWHLILLLDLKVAFKINKWELFPLEFFLMPKKKLNEMEKKFLRDTNFYVWNVFLSFFNNIFSA